VRPQGFAFVADLDLALAPADYNGSFLNSKFHFKPKTDIKQIFNTKTDVIFTLQLNMF
jgi:hypothetical protein